MLHHMGFSSGARPARDYAELPNPNTLLALDPLYPLSSLDSHNSPVRRPPGSEKKGRSEPAAALVWPARLEEDQRQALDMAMGWPGVKWASLHQDTRRQVTRTWS